MLICTPLSGQVYFSLHPILANGRMELLDRSLGRRRKHVTTGAFLDKMSKYIGMMRTVNDHFCIMEGKAKKERHENEVVASVVTQRRG